MTRAAVALVLAWTLQDVPSVALTADQIQSAISDGQSRKELKPLRVGRRATLVRSAIAVHIGDLYLPELRVALAARAAKNSYREFGPKDVTSPLAGDYALIVLPPQETFEKNPMERYTDVETVLALPKGSKDAAQAIRPLWTESDVATYQNLFGATWEQKTVVAAFPLTVVSPDIEIVAVYRSRPQMGGGESRREIRGVLVDKPGQK